MKTICNILIRLIAILALLVLWPTILLQGLYYVLYYTATGENKFAQVNPVNLVVFRVLIDYTNKR